ncbi:MAG: tRNA (adenosine(37)-N6)-threonylcarbamoyltransferase complex transferase subunit TsaD [Firmicutes bacterium]|nr:tRNA (adenosine(37)-N6)-threonylcarbamoyltransferase complex transferase subunit TsaD [Bacillota bacterium]
MKILAFESSCDETAVSVVEDGRRVLANAVNSQVEIHRVHGGVVPEIASRNHIKNILPLTVAALEAAGMTLADVDAVAVTNGAGLVGALLVGVSAAKALAYALNVPLVAVSHIRAHVAANYITYPELEPPFTALVVSGGHTMIAEQRSHTELDVIRETADDAAGEAFDKVARVLGYPYPGGALVDKNATGRDDIEFFKHAKIIREGSFSYSGLKTAAVNYIHNKRMKGEPLNEPDICASFTRYALEPLIKAAVGQAGANAHKRLVLAGGVAANSYLRRRLNEECAAANIALYMPELKYCADNAAMVGSLAYYYARAGIFADLTLNAEPGLN